MAVLTDLGHAKVMDAAPGHVQVVHQLVLDRLTGAQARQLREISGRITAAIREDGAWKPS